MPSALAKNRPPVVPKLNLDAATRLSSAAVDSRARLVEVFDLVSTKSGPHAQKVDCGLLLQLAKRCKGSMWSRSNMSNLSRSCAVVSSICCEEFCDHFIGCVPTHPAE